MHPPHLWSCTTERSTEREKTGNNQGSIFTAQNSNWDFFLTYSTWKHLPPSALFPVALKRTMALHCLTFSYTVLGYSYPLSNTHAKRPSFPASIIDSCDILLLADLINWSTLAAECLHWMIYFLLWERLHPEDPGTCQNNMTLSFT